MVSGRILPNTLLKSDDSDVQAKGNQRVHFECTFAFEVVSNCFRTRFELFRAPLEQLAFGNQGLIHNVNVKDVNHIDRP